MRVPMATVFIRYRSMDGRIETKPRTGQFPSLGRSQGPRELTITISLRKYIYIHLFRGVYIFHARIHRDRWRPIHKI